MLTDDNLKAKVLLKLVLWKKWGASHTSFEDALKGISMSDLGKKGMRRAKHTEKELIRDGWIIPKITGYGLHVSLNPKRAQEIKGFIREHLGIDLE